MDKPLLAITMGDPSGVGPETIVGAWANAEVHAACRMVVVGRPAILRRATKLLSADIDVIEVATPEEAIADTRTMPCLPCGSADAERAEPAVMDARGGQAAHDALALAAQLALAGRVHGLTTAPLNKAALWAAGYHYPGHTELLAEFSGVEEVAMMLYLAPGGLIRGRAGLGVAHVTLHMAQRLVADQLTTKAVVSKARLADAVVRALLEEGEIKPPCIGVCALNPHAGEEGLFGDEEERIIRPAIEIGASQGLLLEGPLPSDTLMVRAAAGEFDAVVAMYHDQGHIALKLLGMHRAVNITLGLPIIRTSVAHGTAFDLAWTGKAKSTGMVEAIKAAAQLIRRRTSLVWSGRESS